MDKLGLLVDGNPHFRSHFQYFFLGTQIGAICGILNLIFLGDNVTGEMNALFFRLDLIALFVGFIITAIIYSRLHRHKNISLEQYTQTTIIFLWLWSIVMTVTVWFEGGLYSSLLLSFPVLMVFAALFTELLTFLGISAFLSAAIIFMGFNHTHSWLLPPEGMDIEGVSRIISALVLTTFTGFVCWVFGGLLKVSFGNIRKENQRVLQSQRVIKKIAHCDGLTNLLNRNGATSSYKQKLSAIDFDHEYLIAYFIDLDDFKNINDLFDHQAGDQLLITMSRRLESLIVDDGLVCRFGGDEFVIVFKADHVFDVEAFAGKIIKAIAQPHSILGTEAEVTGSVGIATVSDIETSFLPFFTS